MSSLYNEKAIADWNKDFILNMLNKNATLISMIDLFKLTINIIKTLSITPSVTHVKSSITMDSILLKSDVNLLNNYPTF